MTTISRSQLLKLGVASAVTLGTGAGAGAALAAEHGSRRALAGASTADALEPPAYLRLESYRRLVGSGFRIFTPGPIAARLVEARASAGPGETFSLLFATDGAARVSQETYELEQRQLGRFRLFLVPVGRPGPRSTLQAIVNRLPASMLPLLDV